jgi:NAD(P)-dependent dehydrogenase (short-subunit alcohol dehydrogenase family)
MVGGSDNWGVHLACSVLVVGAGSVIAQALITSYLNDGSDNDVVAITRSMDDLSIDSVLFHDDVECLLCDYSEASIQVVCDELMAKHYSFDRVFICNGVLHSDSLLPEKRLTDFDSKAFRSIIDSNTLTPMLWLIQLEGLARKQAVITVFTARVGSIADNHLGGWYSYRASKAALNMLVKTAAIELNRRHKHWRFVLFHPGTTDTPLSKPFHKGVPKDKLFSPSFVANQLMGILQGLPDELPVQYLDWQGRHIEW